MKFIRSELIFICAVGLLMSACSGKLDANIGGTVNGLSGGDSVVLLDNGTDQRTVTANGSFTFAQQIEAGSTYNVTVATQPTGETCSVVNGVGTIEQNTGDVNSIAVNCVATISANNDIIGTVTGLKSGNTLQLINNGTDTVSVTSTGTTGQSFVFPTPLAVGTTYSIAISSQPSGQTCSFVVNNGTASSVTGVVPTTGISILCQ